MKMKNSQVLAVQWHPEELADVKLLTNFFNKNSGKVEGGAITEAVSDTATE